MLQIRRKRGDLVEFYKILNGLDSVEQKNNLVKSCQENTDGPANNLRREEMCFHMKPANIGNLLEIQETATHKTSNKEEKKASERNA